MLPNVTAQKRHTAMNQRVLAIRGLGDNKLAINQRQPAPAGTELGHASIDEVGAEFVHATKIFVNFGSQSARNTTSLGNGFIHFQKCTWL